MAETLIEKDLAKERARKISATHNIKVAETLSKDLYAHS